MGKTLSKSFLLALAGLVIVTLFAPRASASIIYSICTSGCTDSSGTYSSVQGQSAAAGLTFSPTISFTAANLSNGVYIDPSTNVTFNVSSNPGVPDINASVIGTSLVQGASGTGSGIEIDLPANTFAISLNVIEAGGSFGNLLVNGQSFGFMSSGLVSIVSDSALSSISLNPTGGGKYTLSDFQTGTQSTNSGGGGGDVGDTPEPSTIILIGTGLLIGGFARRRQGRFGTPA